MGPPSRVQLKFRTSYTVPYTVINSHVGIYQLLTMFKHGIGFKSYIMMCRKTILRILTDEYYCK